MEADKKGVEAVNRPEILMINWAPTNVAPNGTARNNPSHQDSKSLKTTTASISRTIAIREARASAMATETRSLSRGATMRSAMARVTTELSKTYGAKVPITGVLLPTSPTQSTSMIRKIMEIRATTIRTPKSSTGEAKVS